MSLSLKIGIIILVLLVQSNSQGSALHGGLIHNYPFRNSMENVINPAFPAINQGTIPTADNQSRSNWARNSNNNIAVVELPRETVHGLTSFTITMWVFLEANPTQFPCMFMAYNRNSKWGDEITWCPNFLGIKLSTGDGTNPSWISTGEWVHMGLTRDTTSNYVTVFMNGVIDRSYTGVFSTGAIDAERVILGNDIDPDTSGNQKPLGWPRQFRGSFTQVKIYNQPKSADDIWIIMQSCDSFEYRQSGTCVVCPERFSRCTDATTGQGCQGSNRKNSSAGCQCLDGYYEDPGSVDCLQCSYPCFNCLPTGVCIDCQGNMTNRLSTCLCQNGYYDIQESGVWKCKICPERYARCTNTTTGQQCKGNNRKNLANDCLCQDGFYEDPATDNCIDCPYPCDRCNSPGNCITCEGQMTNRLSTCLCQNGYYDVIESGVNKCKLCPERYARCTNITTGQQCKGNNRKNLANDCQCLDGFYEDPATDGCIDCPYPCNRCNSPGNCITCEGQMTNRLSTCLCANGYYDIKESGVWKCKICPERYARCTNTTTGQQCKGNNRKNLANDCLCLDGFYEDPATDNCIDCPYPCDRCNSPGNCISCEGQMTNRLSTCLCQNGYYDIIESGVNICKLCPERYARCTNISTGQQCKGINRKNLANDCQCLDGFYEDPATDGCIDCPYPCNRCNSPGNCITCEGQMTNRLSTCLCENGYYDKLNSGVHTCALCPERYVRCSSPSTGQECKGANRKNLTSDCQCLDGFIEDPATDGCIGCNHPCVICSSPGVCQSCSGNLSNRQNPGSCQCENGYYDKLESGVYTCTQCPERFARCSDPSTGQQCKGSNRKTLANDCQCLDGFYDDPVTDGCLDCPYPCNQCNSPFNCINCEGEITNRLSDSCLCSDGFYDILEIGVWKCKQCPERYARCNNPITGQQCKGNNRKNLSNDCQCLDGFYEDPVSDGCIDCPYPCDRCNSPGNCIDCEGQMTNRLSTCFCEDGSYDILEGGQQICKKCPEKYGLCTSESTGQSCKGNNRQNLSNDCQCLEGYYEDPSSDNCIECPFPCNRCSSPGNCIDCKGDMTNRLPNCYCQDGFYNKLESGVNICAQCKEKYSKCRKENEGIECKGINRKNISNDCVCLDGFYEDPNSDGCLSCNYPCFNCTPSGICIDCKGDMTNRLNDGTCLCETGYYIETESNICQKCHKRYAVCSEENNGSVCKGNNRKPIEFQCECLLRFKEDPGSDNCIPCECPSCSSSSGACLSCEIGQILKQGQCEQCHKKCFSCSQFQDDLCLSCDKNQRNRDFRQGKNCECLEGYYEDLDSQNCLRCEQVGCRRCDNQGKCQQCLNLDLLPPLCRENSKGYALEKKNGHVIEYEKCSRQCLLCQNSKDSCVQCIQGLNREQAPICRCKEGYHDNNNQLKDCIKCPKGCAKCINENICLRCEKNSFRELNYYSEQCECLEGYKENQLTNECQKCYSYNGECMFECPYTTKRDDDSFICEKISIQKKNIIPIIWICFSVLLIIILAVFGSQISYTESNLGFSKISRNGLYKRRKKQIVDLD